MQITNASDINAELFKRYRGQIGVVQNDGREVGASGQQTNGANDSGILRQVQALKKRDLEVRNHEQAHLSAAGGIAIRGATFQYVTGPDGLRYATAGEVSIDTSAVAGDPEATLRKAEMIRRAALAPAQPSAQDYSVAAKASAMANKAVIELLRGQKGSGQIGSLLDISV